MKEVKVRVPGWAGSLSRYKRTQEFHMKYLKNGKNVPAEDLATIRE